MKDRKSKIGIGINERSVRRRVYFYEKEVFGGGLSGGLSSDVSELRGGRGVSCNKKWT